MATPPADALERAMIASMTGFARTDGTDAGVTWMWELRSVNGRAFDLRLRLPIGTEALDAPLREVASAVLRRGTITANLTTRREERPSLVMDPEALERMLALLTELAERLPDSPPPRVEAVLGLPGVLRGAPQNAEPDPAALTAIRAGFDAALAALITARRAEGGRLAVALGTLLDGITATCARAEALAASQPHELRDKLTERVRALLEGHSGPPLERLAQEVALLAQRADVREELDRLASHIAAARTLLGETAPVGRRLDFLVQEFNREANTLCAKAATIALTTEGLALKALVEQLREQVQNLE